ncbi:MAG: dual specificity protein phosphatase family protein [Gemmataceae bacterium]|nr:dual specificity protein phosphatase family protein [Gemmataceae bacterium]MCI0742502.1 dual specificity protein phosphatase family protein [Gemmataceae bacterium]
MTTFWRWTAGAAIVLLMILVPTIHYRNTYTHSKRLRTVVEGKIYRSGCMTAEGFREAIQKYKIKTVLNLQDEAPDPDLRNHYFTTATTKESEVLSAAGAKMEFLPVELTYPWDYPEKQPATIERFLAIMDNPDNYPILIHCRAGLHRTGCLVALYRMEYQGWSKDDALRELKNHGFGETMSTSANPYIVQYILGYVPRSRPVAGERLVPGRLTSRNE